MRIHFLFAINRNWLLFGAKLIAWAEKLPCSHFAIGVEYGDSFWVYESVFPKSRKIPYSKWVTKYNITHRFQYTVPLNFDQSKLYSWLESQLNKWYALDQILLIGITLLNSVADKISNKFVLNGAKYLICTEIGSRFAEKFMGYKMKESHDKVRLADMLNISLELENTKVVWGDYD